MRPGRLPRSAGGSEPVVSSLMGYPSILHHNETRSGSIVPAPTDHRKKNPFTLPGFTRSGHILPAHRQADTPSVARAMENLKLAVGPSCLWQNGSVLSTPRVMSTSGTRAEHLAHALADSGSNGCHFHPVPIRDPRYTSRLSVFQGIPTQGANVSENPRRAQ